MAKVRQWLYLKDEEGVPIEDAYLHLYLNGTETQATIFSDSIGTSLDQSTWTTGTSGFFDFYIGNEWDAQGYTANQTFDLAWQLEPFDGYITSGDMETNPVSAYWSMYNSIVSGGTILDDHKVRSGLQSMKVIDKGDIASAYQVITTAIGAQYRVTGYTYIPSTLGVTSSNIFVGTALTTVDQGASVTAGDAWTVATFTFVAGATNTYVHLNCNAPSGDGTEHVFFDDVSVDRITAGTNYGLIDRIQLFPFLFSVDETDTDSDKNKLLNNQLAYDFEEHVVESYSAEPHNIEPVNTSLKDGTKNKVVSNALMDEVDALLTILLATEPISAGLEKINIKTTLLDSFTLSGNGSYYTDVVYTLPRQDHPAVQFYEYLKDPTTWGAYYRGIEPIRTSVSAGSFEIINPITIQDRSPSAIRVWTVNDNWLMATVAGSGSR